MHEVTRSTNVGRVIGGFGSPFQIATLPRTRHYRQRIYKALSQSWHRIRAADISIIMLAFGLLLAVIVILGLALEPVARRH